MRRLLTLPKMSHRFRERFDQRRAFSLLLAHLYSFDILLEYLFDSKPRTVLWRFLQMSAFFRALVITLIIDLRFLRHPNVIQIFQVCSTCSLIVIINVIIIVTNWQLVFHQDISRYPTFNFEYRLTGLSTTVKNLMLCYFVFIALQTIVSIDALFRESSESDPYMNLIFHTNFQSNKILVIFKIFRYNRISHKQVLISGQWSQCSSSAFVTSISQYSTKPYSKSIFCGKK